MILQLSRLHIVSLFLDFLLQFVHYELKVNGSLRDILTAEVALLDDFLQFRLLRLPLQLRVENSFTFQNSFITDDNGLQNLSEVLQREIRLP